VKIAMIISTPFPPEEGIGNHVYNLSKKLIERGYEITVITRGSLRTTQVSTLDGIKVIKVPFIPTYPFHVNIHGFFVNRLLKSLDNEFDIVHIHTPLTPVIKTSIPVVSTIHTSLIEDARYIEAVDFKSLAIKALTKFVSYPLVSNLIKASDVVTTVSNSVAQELKEYYGVNKPVIVGNGVDENTFKAKNGEKDEHYILYVGRLSYRKGLFDLLNCAEQICEVYDVQFILVGKGEFEKTLRKRVKEIGLENKVIFLGYVEREKLIKLYQNAVLLVIPSYYESGPLVLLEAMSCGTPVVSTPVGIAPEIMEKKKNGILIPLKSPKKMAEAISILIEDDKLRRKLGNNARKTIERGYTWDSVTDRVENCYKSAE